MSEGSILLVIIAFCIVPVGLFFGWVMTSSYEHGLGFIVHKVISLMGRVLLVVFIVFAGYFIFAKRTGTFLTVSFFILSCLFPNSFYYFFVRPRQNKLDQQYSRDLEAYQSAKEAAAHDVDSLITSLQATDTEVYNARLIADKKIPLDPVYYSQGDDPHVIAALVPFMEKYISLSFPDKKVFHPTRLQRLVGFAIHMLAVILIVVGLYSLSTLLLFSQDNPTHIEYSPPTSASAEEGKYVSSINSDKFHNTGCQYVDNISSGNKVYYETREDAIADGKTACSVCDP